MLALLMLFLCVILHTMHLTLWEIVFVSLRTGVRLYLLEYVITRRDSEFASNCSVADKISDHMALHVSLACQRPHPERKEVYIRALRRINNDSLEADLACLNIDIECECCCSTI